MEPSSSWCGNVVLGSSKPTCNTAHTCNESETYSGLILQEAIGQEAIAPITWPCQRRLLGETADCAHDKAAAGRKIWLTSSSDSISAWARASVTPTGCRVVSVSMHHSRLALRAFLDACQDSD